MANETRWVNVTFPRLAKWAKRNLRRLDFGQRPQPFMLMGSPGMGKTVWTKDTYPKLIAEYFGVKEEEVGYYEFNCNGKDEIEATGPALPWKNPETSEVEFRYGKSPIVRAIEEKIKRGGYKYLVGNLDEFGQGTQGLQKTLRGLLNPQMHAIGDSKAPDNVFFMATSNRASDKSGSISLLKHIPNVCKVMNLVFSMSALKSFWFEHKLNPAAIECAEAFHEDGFFCESIPVNDEAYCTPRSLENASYDMDVIMSESDFTGSLTTDDRDYLITTIGRAAADTLMTWINRHDHLPSAYDILGDPRHATVPDQTGYQSVAAHMALNAVADEHTANAALIYISRLRPDLQVPLLTKLIKECNSRGWSFTTDEAINFLEKYSELLPLAWNC
jgi:hypothetical protein